MTKPQDVLDQHCVNTIRFLSADAIQKAQSGHPGLPMGSAPMGYVLWDKFLKFNPKNPKWLNRDRFVLSAGHGSMIYYSLLHLTGYDSVSMEDIQQFRQWKSNTPGHPENKVTAGVEVTTGCLGQGIANAVGFALAEAHLSARFNKPDCPLIDHYTYCILGDGCQMVGLTSEACSLAGHLGLGKLIALYDDNQISIDGPTSLAFTEDTVQRFKSYGWHVQEVKDGDNDLNGIAEAIKQAKAVTDKPSLICVRTTIGYGAPTKAGDACAHGAPLGDDEIAQARKNLGYEEPPFVVAQEVLDHMQKAISRGAEKEAEWNKTMAAYSRRYPEESKVFTQLVSETMPDNWEALLPKYTPEDKPKATRVISGECLNALAGTLSGMIGGSADLAPSNKTAIKGWESIQKGAHQNRNIHFGVREHAMAAICTGMAHYGSGFIPYCGTFMVFSDYMRGAIRIAALSGAGVIFIMSHDSVAVGEDGPTHQPVEHVSALRAIPNLNVLRPADGNETSGAYMVAVGHAVSTPARPSLLSLSRQSVKNLAETSADGVKKGAYIVVDCDNTPEIILIGTGSELALCVEGAKQLQKEGIQARAVSMPCTEIFEEQDDDYKEAILPKAVTKRLVVEAGTSYGWHRYFGVDGDSISIDGFGTSAPGATCLKNFGYSLENVVAKSKKILG